MNVTQQIKTNSKLNQIKRETVGTTDVPTASPTASPTESDVGKTDPKCAKSGDTLVQDLHRNPVGFRFTRGIPTRNTQNGNIATTSPIIRRFVKYTS